MGIVLTHSAKYKPMSFDEMIKPYQMMTDEYRKLEAGISELETKAETYRQQAMAEPEGSKAKTMYEQYAANLDKQAETLAKQGLKGFNRKALYDLQNQYSTNIVPIETAINYRSKIAEEQRKLDPKYVVDRDFSQVTLDELIADPNLGYNRYDLEDYSKQAVLEGASIKAQMKPKYLGEDESGQSLIYSQGMSAEHLYNWLSGTESDEVLDDAVDRIVGTAPQSVRTRVKTDLAKSLRATVSTKDNKAYDYTQRKNLALFQHNLNEISKTNAEKRKAKEEAKKQADDEYNKQLAERELVMSMGAISDRGADINHSESTKRMEGLSEGITNRLAGLKLAQTKAKNEYDQYLEDNPNITEADYLKEMQELQRLEQLLSAYEGDSSSTDYTMEQVELSNQYHTLKGRIFKKYHKLIKLQRNLNSANQALSDEEAFIQDFENNYWYLGSTREERLQRGYDLQWRLEQSKEEDVRLNINPTDKDKVATYLADILSGSSEGNIKSGSIGLQDSKGKKLSEKEINTIIADPEKLDIKVIKKKNSSQLALVLDNEEYTIKDSGAIDRWLNETTQIQTFLSDFDIKSTKNKSNVKIFMSEEAGASLAFKLALSRGNIKDYIDTGESETESSWAGQQYLDEHINEKMTGEKIGDNLYAYTVVDAASKDMYKIITDSQGNIKAFNMASDEINNEGRIRNTYVDENINILLYNLVKQATKDIK